MKSLDDQPAAGIHCNETTCGDVTEPEVWRTLIVVYLGAVLILSVVFNGTLCLVFYKKSHLLNISNCFVMNLSCCHLVMSMLVLPFSFYAAVSPSTEYSGHWCEVQGFFFTVVIVSVQFSLLAISLDRNYAIMNSLRYPNVFTQTLCTIMIGTSWVVGVIISVPPLLRSGLGSYTYHPYQFICTLDWRGTSAYLICFHVFSVMIPVVVQSFCYLKIFLAALGHSKRSQRVYPWVTSTSGRTIKDVGSDSSDSGESVVSDDTRRGRKQCKAVRTIFLIAIAYCICWVPYLADSYITFTRKIYSHHLSACAICLVFTTGVLNPVIYAYMNRVTRREIKRFLCGTPAINESDDFVSTSMSTYSSAKQSVVGWTAQQRMRSKSTGGLNEMDTIVEEAEEGQTCETRSIGNMPIGEAKIADKFAQAKPGSSSSRSVALSVFQLKDLAVKHAQSSNGASLKTDNLNKPRCSFVAKGKSRRLPESAWNVVHTDKFIDERRRNSKIKSDSYFQNEKRRKHREYGSFLYFETEESCNSSKRQNSGKSVKKSNSQRLSLDHVQKISIATIPKLLKFRFSVSDIDSDVKKVTVRSNVEIENNPTAISIETDDLESSSCDPFSPVFGDTMSSESAATSRTNSTCNDITHNVPNVWDTECSPVPVSPGHVLTDVTSQAKGSNKNIVFNDNVTAFEYQDVFVGSRLHRTARRSL